MNYLSLIFWIIIIVVIIVTICICDLVAHTKTLTKYLYMRKKEDGSIVIYQRTINSFFAAWLTRKEFKIHTINDEIHEFGQQFLADFEVMFDKLEPNVKYVVTTHYHYILSKAERDGKIQIISSTANKNRELNELKHLLGRHDYKLAKACFRTKPQTVRCCENCKRKPKCLCRRGGRCHGIMRKIFVTYEFVKIDVDKI